LQQINGKNCAVLTLADIEDAERLCREWNGKKATENNYIKVHIHPYSSRKRPSHIKSIFPIFHNLFVPSLEPTKQDNDLKDQMTQILTMKPFKEE
jgi:hypothetical protein